MQRLALLCAVIGIATSAPDGYYHQRYQAHQESASYKNNELQHKNEDDSFYSKHGELDGAAEPKVNQYSHHTQYRNPKLGNGDNADSHGQLQYGSDAGLSQRYEQPGYETLGGGSGYLHQGSGSSNSRSSYGSSAYGSHGSSAYGSLNGASHNTANLERLTQQLQEDLSQQLRVAVAKQQQQQESHTISTHPGYSSADLHAQFDSNQALLEQELRSNLTLKLQEELSRQYGRRQQTGAYTYGVNSDGSHGSNPLYSNEQLQRLTSQVEDNLVRQLEESMQSQQRYKSLSTGDAHRDAGSRLRAYPNLNQQTDGDARSWSSHSSWSSSSSWGSGGADAAGTQGADSQTREQAGYVRLPVTLSELESILENKLSKQIQKAITQEEVKYTASVNKPDIVRELDVLSDQLKDNLTTTYNNEIRNVYSSSNQQGYTYTSADVENLKREVERKLLSNLQQQLQAIPSRTYQQSHSRYSSSHSSSLNQAAAYPDTAYHASTSYEIVPTITVSGGNSQHLQQLVRALQTQLNQDLQSTLSRQRYIVHDEYALQQLTEELKRNLTEKINEELQRQYGNRGQHYTVMSSGVYYYPTSSYNAQQLQSLTQQLQNQLVDQLETGYRQQSSSSSSSYSQSAAYNSGGYSSGAQSGKLQQYGNYNRQPSYGACCEMQSDAAAHTTHQHDRDNVQQVEGNLRSEALSHYQHRNDNYQQRTENTFENLRGVQGQEVEDVDSQHTESIYRH